MQIVHRVLGISIVSAFVLIMLSALVLRLRKVEDTPTWLRGIQFWTENLVAVQLVLGFTLLAIGRRVVGGPLVWFHYLYGSLFVVIALTGGRIAALRREERSRLAFEDHGETIPARAYVGLGWGAFFAFGLTLRALMTGLGWTL